MAGVLQTNFELIVKINFSKKEAVVKIYNVSVDTITIITIASLLSLSLIFNFNGNFWNNVINQYYLLFFILGITSLLLLQWRKIAVFNFLDLSIISLLIYQVISRLSRLGYILEIDNLTTVALIIYYISLKSINWKHKNVLLYYTLISVICFGICFCSFLELFNIIDRTNISWKFSGNFFNPGLLGGFLALVLSLPLFLVKENLEQKKWAKVILFLIIALITITFILLSQSRAGILSAIIVLLFFIPSSVKRQVNFLFVFCLLSLPIIIFIFFGKGFDSIYGRLFIWKISSQIFVDNIIFGVGYNFFRVDYLNYQAAYFASGIANANEIWIAGNTIFAFNEFVKFIVENGIAGLGLLLLFVVYSLRYLSGSILPSYIKISSVAIFSSFFLFSQFSYPLYALCFKLILLNQIAILSNFNNSYLLNGNNKFTFILCYALTIILFLGGMSSFNGICYWKKASYIQHVDIDRAKNLFKRANLHLKYKGQFLYAYGSFLQEIDLVQSTELLEESKKTFTSKGLFRKLAENYRKLDKIESEEKMLLKVHHMIPILLTPQKDLMYFYFRQGNYFKARFWASNILNTPIKVKSYSAMKIKKEARIILENKN